MCEKKVGYDVSRNPPNSMIFSVVIGKLYCPQVYNLLRRGVKSLASLKIPEELALGGEDQGVVLAKCCFVGLHGL